MVHSATARQRQAAELYDRLGSFGGVGLSLGITPVAARALVRRCWANDGRIPPDVHPSKVGRYNLERIISLEERLALLTSRLSAVESRPPSVVEWRPDHRRIVDGGSNVNRQRRLVLRAARRAADG